MLKKVHILDEDRARALLDYLVKRPARDYWKFIESLYHETVDQGHIAGIILE
jgi:hypothetical protein